MPEENTVAASSTSEAVEEKPCSSSAAESSGDVAEEAKKLIGTGNRHLVMGDVVSAVTVFQEACAMLAEKYGDTADECGEAFFLCGKSLLELARMENSVLGNALEGVPEESSEEGEKQNDSKIESADNLDERTRDELREQVYEAMSVEKGDSQEGEPKVDEEEQEVKETTKENATETGEKTEVLAGNGEKTEVPAKNGKTSIGSVKGEEQTAENVEVLDKDGSSKQEDPVTKEAKEDAEQDVKCTEEPSGNEQAEPMEEDAENDNEDDDDDEEADANAEDKEEEEDVGNLQLAWEMLEVAKVIYKRKESKEDQLMAAQIFLKLGEVGAESGNYNQALEDFQECLSIQLKHLPPHSRLLAETHYQLGMTFSYTGKYSQAIQQFNNSIKVIESRLVMLQEVIDKTEGAEGAAEEKRELAELKQLLPEIAEKVEDAKESQQTAPSASEAIHQTLGGASTSSGFAAENSGSSSSTATLIAVKPAADSASSSKSASDISHLVRKKRKPEDESPKKDSDAKKVKQETTVNGSADSASNSNGVQEKMEQEAVNSSTSAEATA
ncbi:nuclear autoantigenic sperm protein isoform X3 [Ictalurus punctatus]|uniref:Nuclear autoantigenic sperm protein isoform X3 n=1 Tax=Ictalurus punctatus TaxID=7998 RepID=A0A2D0RZC2_ICTPU|nr:nuclear autoantigenic sperm protein isoform X3 [Ictalurus punctatus]